MASLGNRLAKLEGYGDGYFDNISFDYLYALIPEDKSPE